MKKRIVPINNKDFAKKKAILPNTRLSLLKKYYLEVFQVEIVDLLIKESNSKKPNKFNLVLTDDEPAQESVENMQNYIIAVWIKDYNKLFFKTKVIKLNFKSTKSKKWIISNMENENFIKLIDLQVNEYCRKYMMTAKDMDKIQDKNDNFYSKLKNNSNDK